MKKIEIKSIDYNPNIRLLNNHIITFNDKSINIFDLKGFELDKISIDIEKTDKIIDIFIINNNNFLAITIRNLFQISINKDVLEIKLNIKLKNKYYDSLYLKKYNLIILSLENNHIRIFDISNIENIGQSIQVIKCPPESRLFNWNDDSFIVYDNQFIFIYQIIFGTKYYQLLTKFKCQKEIENKNVFFQLLTFCEKINFLKLDGKTLLVSIKKQIKLINIKKMKIFHNYYFKNKNDYEGEIKFFKKIENNIYIYYANYLYIFIYFREQLNLIKVVKVNIFTAIDYLIKLSLDYNIKSNIHFNCTKDYDKSCLLMSYIPDEKFFIINRINFVREIMVKMEIEMKEYEERMEEINLNYMNYLKIKNIFKKKKRNEFKLGINKNKKKTLKRIINYCQKKFKKNYR